MEYDTFDFENCGNCPTLSDLLLSVNSVRSINALIVESAMSPELDKLAPQLYEFLGTLQGSAVRGPNGRFIDTPEELAIMFRQNASEMIEHMQIHISEDVNAAQELKYNCGGPLKMRAKKAGQVVTATVCMSPLKEINSISTEEVFIHREPKVG